jgi:hypothetical protein
MIEFVVGVAVGAAFAPFWMKVWTFIGDQWKAFTTKK